MHGLGDRSSAARRDAQRRQFFFENSRHVVDGEVVPLTKGKLQIQSEATEVRYKDIEIRPISSMHTEFPDYFR